MTTRYIDLCCGIGGFRVAVEALAAATGRSFECVLSADVKQDAVDTYNANFGEGRVKTDLTTLIDKHDMPAFDLLCAGFPCQPFSSAGAKRGFDDHRGGIIYAIHALCAKHLPHHFLLENVANLLALRDAKTGRLCIEIIKEMFEAIGYTITYTRLSSDAFGVPQARTRVYIVGSLSGPVALDGLGEPPIRRTLGDVIDTTDTTSDIAPEYVSKVLARHLVRSVIGCRVNDKRGGPVNIHSWELNGDLDADQIVLMNKLVCERRKKHWAASKGIVWTDGMPLTLPEIRTFYEHERLEPMLADLVDKTYLVRAHPKDLVNGRREFQTDQPKGWNLAKGKLSHPISTILDPAGVAPTLTATDANRLVVLLNNRHLRRLNRLELRRICGFPDTHVLPDHVNAYNLFGNMATPPVIQALLGRMYV